MSKMKQKLSKIILSFLALFMVMSQVYVTNVYATLETYKVSLNNGKDVLELSDVEITLTNKTDETDTMSVDTVAGVATFENYVEEGVSYIVSMEPLAGYAMVEDFVVTPTAEEMETSFTLFALESVEITGVVLDENGDPLEGATVKVQSEGFTGTYLTDADGKYLAEVYVGNKYTIYATTTDGKYAKSEIIEVTPEESITLADLQLTLNKLSITTSSDENGTVTTTSDEVSYGGETTITIEAKEGYVIDVLTVGKTVIEEAKGLKTFTYELKDITTSYEVSATFVKLFKLTFTVGENGEVIYNDGTEQVLPSGSIEVNKEYAGFSEPTNVEVTAKPTTGYRVLKVTVDGLEESFTENDKIYTKSFEMNADHIFVVEFAANIYNVTLNTDGNGQATSVETITHGQNVEVTITPNEGYDLGSVKVGETEITFDENSDNYTAMIENVVADTTIDITFVEKVEVEEDSYTITFSGVYSVVNGVTYVPKGSTVSFKVNEGYTRVRINGEFELTGDEVDFVFNDETTVITSIEVSTREEAGWSLVKELDIKYESAVPTISEVNNSDKWFKGEGTYSFTASDEHSGVRFVKYSDKKDYENATELTAVEGVYSFTVANEYEGNYYVWVEDYSGNVTEANEVGIKVDTTAPTITKFEFVRSGDTFIEQVLNFLTFGTFFNDEIKITIFANDPNVSSGIKSITLYPASEESITVDVDEDNKAEFIIPTVEITQDQKVYFNGIVKAVATDNVGNVTETAVLADENNSNLKNSNLMLETIKPVIDEPILNKQAITNVNSETKKEGDWYDGDVQFTLNLSDKDSGIARVEITLEGTSLIEDINNKEITIEFDKLDEVTQKYDFTISTSQVEDVNNDGEYKLEVKVTDNVGNVETLEKTIYIDKTAPTIEKFEFEHENYQEGSTTPVESKDYGFYFMSNTKVTIYADDVNPSSGIKSITYYTVDKDKNESEPETLSVDKEGKVEFVIEAPFKGQIYAKATDNADHTTKTFASPDGTIVESEEIHNKEDDHVVVNINTEINYKDSKEQALFNTDVEVEITIKDTYSGIRDITYEVVAPYDTENNQKEVVEVPNKVESNVDTINGWSITREEGSNLITQMTKKIIVSNNSNDIKILVTMHDRAGNESNNNESVTVISIDKEPPEITIDDTYAPDVDNDNKYPYYKQREAIITVKERNFNPADFAYSVSAGNTVAPELTDWVVTLNEIDPDETVYTAFISFVEDDDYTLTGVSYTDLAGNDGNVIEDQAFTVDNTDPVVTVVYDNMSALNNNYYKADRIATITVTEHNFDPNRVDITGNASDNGVNIEFPSITGWTTEGDVHTTTIPYTVDGLYTFDITVKDLAANEFDADEYAGDVFFVDKTAPEITFGGVANNSANNGRVAPTVTYTDTNFNKEKVTITLTGANNGVVNYSASLEDIANGQTYSYADFERIASVDDVYALRVTLTDMAGNSTTKTLAFSANRFGSVYDLSAIEDINGKFLQTEEDIVIVEVNANALDLDDLVVKLTKNGIPTDLVAGTDYTVEVTGGSGQWYQYRYTIKKSLFADDGRYSISIYSVDASGNINENIDENKSAEISFGIDKTLPVIVPIDFVSEGRYDTNLKEVSIEIKDNLVLENVVIEIDGEAVTYDVNGETYTFNVEEMNKPRDAKIVAVDAAGNELEVSVDDFLVTTNFFVRWYYNTPLFIGSIAGFIMVVGGIILFVSKKKKQEEPQE